MSDRQRQVTLLVGAPASGKTHVLKALALYQLAAGERVRAVDPLGELGGAGEWPRDVEGWLRDRRRRGDTTCLALDEVDKYFPHGPKNDSIWMDICNRHRHLGWDIIATTRKLQKVSPDLRSAVEFLYVFRMAPTDGPGRAMVSEIIPGGLPIPTEPFRFVYAGVYTGDVKHGRTLPGGGFVMDRRGRS